MMDVHLRSFSSPASNSQSSLTRRYVLLVVVSLVMLSFGFFFISPYDDYISFALARPSRPTFLILQAIRYREIMPATDDKDYETEFQRKRIYLASEQSHRLYAATWNYGYIRDDTEWTKLKGGRHFMNKLWTLVAALDRELSLPEHLRHQWIFMSDADTLILQPALPLSVFLPPGDPAAFEEEFPPPERSPLPLILANQDYNGFNSGAVFWRVHPRVLEFMLHAMSLEAELTASAGHSPSDQHLLGYAFMHEANADFAASFYEIPMMWCNEYYLDRHDMSQQKLGDEGALVTPQLQVHLPKNRWLWEMPHWDKDVVERADQVYAEGWRNGGGIGDMPLWTPDTEREWKNRVAPIVSEGLTKSGEGQRSSLTAHRWWRRVKNGTSNIKWNDI